MTDDPLEPHIMSEAEATALRGPHNLPRIPVKLLPTRPSMTENKTTPCETCGAPTRMFGTKRCDHCWEVETRLDRYMRAPKALDVIRPYLPKLDDWVDSHPDAWDFEAVLKEHEVSVEWSHQFTSDGVTFTEAPPGMCGWGFYWKHGVIHIGQTTEIIARKAAALFVSLWLRGVSASFADKLMDAFILYLEAVESTSLTFLVEIETYEGGKFSHLALTREGMFNRACINWILNQKKIVETLGNPAKDEEIIVTFTKRKKGPGQ